MRAILAGALVLLVGCQGVTGPAQRRDLPGPVGAPGRPIDEQETRVRDRLPFSNNGPADGPPTYFVNPLTKSGG